MQSSQLINLGKIPDGVFFPAMMDDDDGADDILSILSYDPLNFSTLVFMVRIEIMQLINFLPLSFYC